jgi:pyruvate,water dikinase
MHKEPIITGRTAVAGEATGRVRVILTSEEADLVQEGEVLVTPMTDPDMLPAMQRASAVITDRGGVLCHAAIICRELGKPCVVGTSKASTVLSNHLTVVVTADARTGAVYVKN